MILLIWGNLIALLSVPISCSIAYNLKCKEVRRWIERDKIALFVQKRPYREINGTDQNAIWDEIVGELNLKIEIEHGIHDYYRRGSLKFELEHEFQETFESLKLVASQDIAGRDKAIMNAKMIKDKDIESTYPPEVIELDSQINHEVAPGEPKETM